MPTGSRYDCLHTFLKYQKYVKSMLKLRNSALRFIDKVPGWPLYKQRSLPNISKPNVQCLHETALFCHREIFITSVITRIQTIIKYKSLLSTTIYLLCEPCPAFWRPKQNPLYYDCKCAERFTITPPVQLLRLGRCEQKPESSKLLSTSTWSLHFW